MIYFKTMLSKMTMNKVKYLISIFFAGCMCSTYGQTNISIIPLPQNIETTTDQFLFKENTRLAPLPGKEWKAAVAPLLEKLKEVAEIHIQYGAAANGNTIVVTQNRNLVAEGYELNITPSKITISAATPTGAYYAVQTILQLLPPQIESDKKEDAIFSIPCAIIKDKPAFGYRGFMLDVARHFMLVGDVKKLIDAMSIHKLNYLHLHLTDNQGWRFESKKYPKLTEVGAFRKGIPYHFTYDYASRPREETYGGYYTQDQLREIVAYAKNKFITIIPEIDMPAHSIAALASYPGLLCVDSVGNKRMDYDFDDGTLCTRDENFKFIFDILDELMAVFPSPYIHLGGDEAAKRNWKGCADCQQVMKTHHLKDYNELQSYFVKRVAKYITDKGRKPIGWDEILEGGLAPNTTVMSWRGDKGGIEAVKQGHAAIMSPNSHSYYDYYLSKEDDEPIAWGSYIPLDKVFNYIPVPADLNAQEAKLIIGGQANLWTELIPDFQQAAYMIFPRLSALSEVLWTNATKRDYPDFVKRLENITPRLQYLGVNYSKHRYELSLKTKKINDRYKFFVEGLKEPLPVYYTIDGSLPTLQSKKYNDTISLNKSATITVAIFDKQENITDKARVSFIIHKGMDAEFTQLVPPSEYYNSGGDAAIDNGILGSGRMFKDNEWLGWNGKPFTGLYKFLKPTNISSIDTRFFSDNKKWVWFPQSIEILSSDDGKNFISVYKEELEGSGITGAVPYKANFPAIKARYLKIIVNPLPVIPKGYNGQGKDAWLMIDEIILN